MKILLSFLRLFSVNDLEFVEEAVKKVLGRRLPHAERNRRFWDRIAEPHILEKMASPAIPSLGDMALYREYLTRIKPDSSIVVLGSTPKIRELLQDLGVRDYLVSDFSHRMIENNLSLAPRIDAAKEVWVKINWSKMPAKFRPVDCIVGDFILNQIPPNSQSDFLEKMSRFLNSEGIFIVREHVMNQNLASIDSECIIQESFAGLSPDNAAVRVTALFYRLRDKLRDSAKQITPPGELARALTGYKTSNEFEKELLRRSLVEILRRSRDNLDYNAQTEEELESNITKFFRIEARSFANDYEDAKYFPAYLLRKK